MQAVLDLPAQIRAAWRIGTGGPLALLAAAPRHLLICGMGGSAIGGDLLASFLAPRLALPLVVVRDDHLPAYVGPGSVVIASSYSGGTEETLAAAEQAVNAGATVLAVTSGGALAEKAATSGQVILVPGGLSPRAALGYLMIPALAVLERWGLAGPCAGEVDETARVLEEMAGDVGPSVPASRNPAKRLAAELAGRVPLIYAAAPALEAVARRWKCQFNENSKTLAAWNMFPELTHNETVGWGAPPEITGMVAAVILLAGDESNRALLRIRAASELAFRGAAGVHEVPARGPGRLARMLSLAFFGDLVSVYLAYLRGVDPTPVTAIDSIKRRMREATEAPDAGRA